MQSIQQLLKDACEEAGDESINFRNDYSGRGMYGRRCVGITGTMAECQLIIAEVIKQMSSSLVAAALAAGGAVDITLADQLADKEDDFDLNVTRLLNFCRDSMGMSGVILYWPELECLEEDNFDTAEELGEHEDYIPPQM